MRRFDTISFTMEDVAGNVNVVAGKIVVFPEKCSGKHCISCSCAFKKHDIVVDLGEEMGAMCAAHLPPQDTLYDDLKSVSDFVEQYVTCRWVQMPLERLSQEQLDEWMGVFLTMLASFDPSISSGGDDDDVPEIHLWEIVPLIQSALHDGGVLSSFGPDSPYRVQVMPLALEIDKFLLRELWKPFVNDDAFAPNCVMKAAATSFGRWIVRHGDDESDLGPCVLRQEWGNDKALRYRRDEKKEEKAQKMRRCGTESIHALLAFIDTQVRVTVAGHGGVVETLPAGRVLLWDSDYQVEILGSCVAYWGGLHSCSHVEKVYGVDMVYHEARIEFALGCAPLEKTSCHFKAYGYKQREQPTQTLRPITVVEHPLIYSIQDRHALLNHYDEVMKSFTPKHRSKTPAMTPVEPLPYAQSIDIIAKHPLLQPPHGDDEVKQSPVTPVDDDDADGPTVSSEDDDGGADLSEFFSPAVARHQVTPSMDQSEKKMSVNGEDDDGGSQADCDGPSEEHKESSEESAIDTAVSPELYAAANAFRKLSALVLDGSIVANTDKRTKAYKAAAARLAHDLGRYERGSKKINEQTLTNALASFNKRVEALRAQPVLPEGKKRKRAAPSLFHEEYSVSLEEHVHPVDARQIDLDAVWEKNPRACENEDTEVGKLYAIITKAIEQAANLEEPEEGLLEAMDKDIARLDEMVDALGSPVPLDDDDDDDDAEDVMEEDDDECLSSAFEPGVEDEVAELRTHNELYRKTIAETRRMIPLMDLFQEGERDRVVSKLGRILTKKNDKHLEALSRINRQLAKRKRSSTVAAAQGDDESAKKKVCRPSVSGFVVQMYDAKLQQWRDMMPINGITVAPIYLKREHADAHAKAICQDILKEVAATNPKADPSSMVRVQAVTR